MKLRNLNRSRDITKEEEEASQTIFSVDKIVFNADKSGDMLAM